MVDVFANKLSEDPENPTIFYTAQDFQDVRDWLDDPTNGHSDVGIMYNVRNNSADSISGASNENVDAILAALAAQEKETDQ